MSLPPDPDFKHSEQSVSAGFKKTLRKTLLDIRKNMTADEHVRFDHEIGRQVSRYLRSRMFKTIGVYLPIRSEPDLLELYEELSAKMHLSLPVTSPTKTSRCNSSDGNPATRLSKVTIMFPFPQCGNLSICLKSC